MCVVSIRIVWVSFCQGLLHNVPFQLLTCHIIKLAGVYMARLVRDSWTVSIRSWEIMIISWMLSSNQLLSWQQLSRHFKQEIHSLRNWTCWCGCLASLLHPLCSCLLFVRNVARCARSAGSSERAWQLPEAGWRSWWETESHPARIHPADECATSNWRGQALGWGSETIWRIGAVSGLKIPMYDDMNIEYCMQASECKHSSCRVNPPLPLPFMKLVNTFDQLKSFDIIWYEIAVVGMFDVGCIWKGPR